MTGRDAAANPDAQLACEQPLPDLAVYFRRELPADLASCLVIAVALTLLIAPFFSDGEFSFLPALLVNGIASICIGLTVANSFRFLVPPLRRRFPGAVANVLILGGIGLGSTALGVELAVRAMAALRGSTASQLRPDVLRVGLVIVTIVVAIDMAYERLRRRARRNELRAEQARKQALGAQLKALQARTNPHFLFNSLNVVSGLIEEDPVGAERVLEHLSELFRYALKGADGGWVRMADEVTATESYLEVESIRLGDRLRTGISVPAELAEVLVPPLILQPLVENAVLHGVAPRKDGGRVEVTVRSEASSLVLTVEDDGRGPGSSPHNGSGTSLAEMAQRLEMIYAGSSTLEAGSRDADGSGFRVRITLPMEARARTSADPTPCRS